MRFCILVALATLPAALALDTHTAVVSNDASQVVANDPNGNTATNTNDNAGNVGSNYNVGGNGGQVNANSALDGSTIGATGPNGEAQSGTIDTSALNANIQASTGDSIVAQSSPRGIGESTLDVNGNPNYKVHRPDEDKLNVEDVTGGNGNFKVSGIKTQKDINVVDGNNKQYEAQMTKDADGTTHTKLKEKTFLNFGPASASDMTPPNDKNGGSTKIGYNPLDSGSSNPLSSIAPSATVTVDKIDTKPCPEKEYGDVFGDTGIKIIDKSIRVELPPSADDGSTQTYNFPGCFIIHATVQVPTNIDPRNLGGQVQATVAQAGDLQCDNSMECQSAASGKPAGPCFFCDFCEKDGSQKGSAVFGGNADTEWNICSAKPGSQLPLQWKMCPKDGNNYNVLSPNILNMKGDIETTIKIYLLKSGARHRRQSSLPSFCTGWFASFYPACKKGNNEGSTGAGSSWQLVGCRKSVISYKVSALNGAVNYGSSNGIFGRRRK